MFSKIVSLGVDGLQGYEVTVEADTGAGLPQFNIVGLPDNAIKESADRVRSALKNSGFKLPQSRITINLAPADIRKSGSVYDLPILLALLTSSKQLNAIDDDIAFVGELSLDGNLRAIKGVLAMALAAKEIGITTLFVPKDNAKEAAAVDGLTVYAAENVADIVFHLKGIIMLEPEYQEPFYASNLIETLDFKEVRGQPEARRAIEIAAAGGLNILLIGSPGTGKSMLAKRLPSILPPFQMKESIETTKIHSVAGILPQNTGLVTTRPFRSPHHTVSSAGMAGGGMGSQIRPGEVSLAHGGVLFLDELPEFHRDTLEILRQPLEDGVVTISRVGGTAVYPCNFILVAAMNPCPCGYFGHPTRQCTCNEYAKDRYLRKISGPLLDRIDLHVEVSPVEYKDLASEENAEDSQSILKRVIAAREIQTKRYKGTDIYCNAQLSSKLLRKTCVLTNSAENLLKMAFDKMGLSARAYDRILKVARTIADLSGSELIDLPHISEAIQYRSLDRKYWYNQ